MKPAPASPPWLPIIAGALAVLTAGITMRQCGADGAAGAPQNAHVAAQGRGSDADRGGWRAQAGRPADISSAATGGGRVAGDVGNRTGRTGGSHDTTDRGRGIARRDYHDTDIAPTSHDAIAVQPHLPPVDGGAGIAAPDAGDPSLDPSARPPVGQAQHAATGSDPGDAPHTHDLAETDDPPSAGTGEGEGPVLSLPLDKSVAAEDGSQPPVVAQGVTFDAEGAYFAPDAAMHIPSRGYVNPAAGTITFWLMPEWAGDTETDAMLVHLGGTHFENHATFFKNGRYLRFLFADDSGFEAGGGHDVSNWKPGERHMVTGTWGDGVTVFYIDGVAVDAREYNGNLVLGPDPPFYIGSGHPNIKSGASSNIRHFQVYTRALHDDEIAALYARPPS